MLGFTSLTLMYRGIERAKDRKNYETLFTIQDEQHPTILSLLYYQTPSLLITWFIYGSIYTKI
jgi:hypothetical protein